MRIVSLFFLLTLALPLNGQTKNPFILLKYDKVILYDYQPAGEDPSLVDNKGQLVSSVIIKKMVQPDTTVIKQLNKLLGDKKSYGQVTAMCFDPHLGIVYYLNGQIVRQVLVCMDCNVVRSDIEIPAQLQNKQGQGDKTYYLGGGMSKSFRHFLNGLLQKYSFSHQIKPGSQFD